MSTIIEEIYSHSPAFLQNIMVSGYGVKIYLREYGREFRRQLDQFNKYQWYNHDELRAYQDEKFCLLIKHCFDNVPFYRNFMKRTGIDPSDIRGIEDIGRFPVLTKDDIRENLHDMVATNIKSSDLIHGHTSGTTGAPLQFYYDKNICLIKNVCDWRQKQWAGINPGDPIAFFLGRMVVPLHRKNPPFWRTNYLLNHTFYSSFHLSTEHIASYIKHLRKSSPAAIEGYPSTLFLMARFLLSRNEIIPMKAAFTSSETLFPIQREAIEKAFNCRLFDFYGLAERTVFATECEYHEGHHLNSDFGITEILSNDNQPVRSGNLGFIVSTGLHNMGMPLIRYRVNDVTSIKSGKCSCGRHFPLMDDVTTKMEDIITTPDGRLISSSTLTHPFKPLKGVIESQIIQEDLNHITIKIVKDSAYTDEDSAHLIDELRKRLGNEMNIDLQFVDSIPRTAAGKFRWVISKIPLDI